MFNPHIAIKIKELQEQYSKCTDQEIIDSAIKFAESEPDRDKGVQFFRLIRQKSWARIAQEFPSFEFSAKNQNEIMSVAQFAEQYGDDEHEAYPMADWDLCAKHGHTDLEYWEWVREQIVDEAGEGMNINDEADRWSGADAHLGEARATQPTSSPSPSP